MLLCRPDRPPPRAPPAIRLEQLKGDRAGQWNIRVNSQFRICFRWTGTDAEDAEIATAAPARIVAKIKPWTESPEARVPAH